MCRARRTHSAHYNAPYEPAIAGVTVRGTMQQVDYCRSGFSREQTHPCKHSRLKLFLRITGFSSKLSRYECRNVGRIAMRRMTL